MKNAIVTPPVPKELEKITLPLMEAYAKRIDADFKILKNDVVIESLNRYERICYLSPKILISSQAPNIFEEVPKGCVGIFNDAAFNKDAKNEKHYDPNVLVFDQSHFDLFKDTKKSLIYYDWCDRLRLCEDHVKMHELSYKWNRIPEVDFKTGESRFNCWFINYTKVEDISVIEKDAKIVKEKFIHIPKRKIWIKAGGGLGDQVQLEPTLRFMLKHIYPNEDVRVSSHWPELYSHLPLKAFRYGENVWPDADGAPWIVESMPPAEHIQWLTVSAMLCHTIDFSSMAVLRRVLPNKDKQIKLAYSSIDLETVEQMCGNRSFKNHVLVHAGYHWNSKSFPKEYWQEIILGLEKDGMTPILIGKNSESQGAYTFETQYSLCLVDKLTLGQLIALISQVPVLLSNDSAPVHIAGAFQNHIVLLPSCKHQDHLLPWREGTQCRKSKALYKKLTLDDIPSAPTEMYTVLGDTVAGEWDEYLPEVSDVVDAVGKFMLSL